MQRIFANVGFLTTFIFGLTVFVIVPVFAQQANPLIAAPSIYCPQISQTIARGSSGNQVIELQKFLSSYYTISPATIQTGYFGRITQSYVIRFQQAQGLPSYGIAGSLTRAAITRVCGGGAVSTNFSASPTSGPAPLVVNFSYPGANSGSYTIGYGDGASGTMDHVETPCFPGATCPGYYGSSHTYTSVGTYTAKLMYQPPFVCNGSAGTFCSAVMPAPWTVGTVTIIVTGNQIGGTFSATPTYGSAPLGVHFAATNMTTSPATIHDWYTVDFGDGTSGDLTLGTCSGSIGCADHTYAQSGTYTARIVHHPDPAANCPTSVATYCGSTLDFNTVTIIVGNTSQVIMRVDDPKGYIQKINPDSVEVFSCPAYPVATSNCTTLKTLHIGDDIGYACEGVSEKLVSIDYLGQTVTFIKIVGKAPFGGCPMCLSGTANIDTPTGLMEVKNISVGTIIWTQGLDGMRHTTAVLQAGKTAVSPEHLMVDLKLDDGRELVVSPGHPLADGRLVGNLHAGDTVQGARVTSTGRIANTTGYTYDILPSGDTGEYWADGILMQSTLRSK